MKISDDQVREVKRFKYLESILSKKRLWERFKKWKYNEWNWLKWKEGSNSLYDERIPVRIKGKFHRSVVKPAIMHYGTEFLQV